MVHVANYLFLLDNSDWSQNQGDDNFSDKSDDLDEIKKVWNNFITVLFCDSF